MTTALLIADLKRDEGLRLRAYPDPLSPLARACREADLDPSDYANLPNWRSLSGDPWTDGYGNAHGVLAGATITAQQAEADLEANAAHACGLLDTHAPWWRSLDPVRQDALANMVFNMGWHSSTGPGDPDRGLASFHHTLLSIRLADWQAAHDGLLASAWAKQVGQRAQRIAHMILTGERL